MRKNTKTRVKNSSPKPQSSSVMRNKSTRAPKVEPAARKQAILDAALMEFSQCGFEAARLDDIADRAGIAKGTLYLYFDDKEGLFEEVVRSAVSPVLERLSSIATAPDLPVDKNFSKPCFQCSKRRSWGPSASS